MFQRRVDASPKVLLKKTVECVCVTCTSRGAIKLWCGMGTGELRVMDFNTGKVEATIALHKQLVTCLTPLNEPGPAADKTPASKQHPPRIWSGSFDKTIKVIDVASRRIINTLSGHKDAITCLTKTAPSRIWSCGLNGQIVLWDTSTMTTLSSVAFSLRSPTSGRTLPVYSLKQMNGMLWLGTGNTIVILDPATMKVRERLPTVEPSPRSNPKGGASTPGPGAGIGPGGKQAKPAQRPPLGPVALEQFPLYGESSGFHPGNERPSLHMDVRRNTIGSLNPRHIRNSHQKGSIASAIQAVRKPGSQLHVLDQAAWYGGGAASVVSPPNGQRPAPTPTLPQAAAHCVVCGRDGEAWSASEVTGTVQVWDTATYKLIREWTLDCGGMIALLHSRNYIWGGAYNGSIYIWDVETHAPVQEIQSHGDAIRCLNAMSEDRMVVSGSGSRDGSIIVWKTVGRGQAPVTKKSADFGEVTAVTYDRFGFQAPRVEDEIAEATCNSLPAAEQDRIDLRNTKRVEDEQAWAKYIRDHAGKPLPLNSAEFQAILRRGIPDQYRKRVWTQLIHTWVRPEDHPRHYYRSLERQRVEPVNQIELDLLRTFPFNKFFSDRSSSGITKLRRVLTAFSIHNKSIVYCQGFNFIAGFALIFLSEEMAFWALVALVEKVMPPQYYVHPMTNARADQRVLLELVERECPRLYSRLTELEIDLNIIAFHWFFIMFVDCFTTDTTLAVWDAMLLSGSEVLFQFAIAVLKLNEAAMLEMEDRAEVFTFMKTMTRNHLNSEDLLQLVFDEKCPLDASLISELRAKHRANILAEEGSEDSTLENPVKRYFEEQQEQVLASPARPSPTRAPRRPSGDASPLSPAHGGDARHLSDGTLTTVSSSTSSIFLDNDIYLDDGEADADLAAEYTEVFGAAFNETESDSGSTASWSPTSDAQSPPPRATLLPFAEDSLVAHPPPWTKKSSPRGAPRRLGAPPPLSPRQLIAPLPALGSRPRSHSDTASLQRRLRQRSKEQRHAHSSARRGAHIGGGAPVRENPLTLRRQTSRSSRRASLSDDDGHTEDPAEGLFAFEDDPENFFSNAAGPS